jgi:hypothetical protein
MYLLVLGIHFFNPLWRPVWGVKIGQGFVYGIICFQWLIVCCTRQNKKAEKKYEDEHASRSAT